jgi:hypothetical protein
MCNIKTNTTVFIPHIHIFLLKPFRPGRYPPLQEFLFFLHHPVLDVLKCTVNHRTKMKDLTVRRISPENLPVDSFAACCDPLSRDLLQ